MPATLGSVPVFQLADGRGRTSGTAEALQRREMVLALLHPAGCPACEAVCRALDSAAAELEGRRVTTLLVVAPVLSGGAAAQAARSPAELVDADGRVARAVAAALGASAPQAWLLVADRFGSIYTALPVHETEAEAAVADAVAWVDFIQMQCPECGAPEW